MHASASALTADLVRERLEVHARGADLLRPARLGARSPERSALSSVTWHQGSEILPENTIPTLFDTSNPNGRKLAKCTT